jgi:hypothetical protein
MGEYVYSFMHSNIYTRSGVTILFIYLFCLWNAFHLGKLLRNFILTQEAKKDTLHRSNNNKNEYERT